MAQEEVLRKVRFMNCSNLLYCTVHVHVLFCSVLFCTCTCTVLTVRLTGPFLTKKAIFFVSTATQHMDDYQM